MSVLTLPPILTTIISFSLFLFLSLTHTPLSLAGLQWSQTAALSLQHWPPFAEDLRQRGSRLCHQGSPPTDLREEPQVRGTRRHFVSLWSITRQVCVCMARFSWEPYCFIHVNWAFELHTCTCVHSVHLQFDYICYEMWLKDVALDYACDLAIC